MKLALVADDSRAVRGILARILKRAGFEVVQAENGRDGIALLQTEERPVALVCADWNMPEMNGLDFVKALRAESRFASTPVMMITSETHFERMQTALGAGVSEYVTKPFTEEVILEKLQLLHVMD
ncbi:response regulator [Silvibacterium sp.]|uniref:response regulator n=1 Tax=Silvibacterium sp. TaxID=1964179 RepID=UPI0039E4D67A